MKKLTAIAVTAVVIPLSLVLWLVMQPYTFLVKWRAAAYELGHG